MSFRTHIEGRKAMEGILAQRAEDLLRARAAKVGVPPRALLRQTLPSEEAEKNAAVRTLLQRLAERDG